MNVADAIGRWAAATPHAVAVNERGQPIDFRTLDSAVTRAAAWLRAQGLTQGDVVGVSLPANSALSLALAYGLARMGAVQMLLPLREGATWRQGIAGRFTAAAIIGTGEEARLEGLPLLQPDPGWLDPGAAAAPPGTRFDGGDAPWMICLSSGTTGVPKGMLRSHRGQILIGESGRRHSAGGPEDRFLVLTDLSFTYGLFNAMQILDGGGMVRIMRPEPPFADIFAVIDHESIDRLAITATGAAALLAHCPVDRPRFPRIRDLTLSAMATPELLRQALRRRFTPNLVITYGTNEAWYVTRAEAAAQLAHPETVGFAYDGVAIEIVDEDGRPLPPGEVGEVRLRAIGLPAGYIDDPQATERAFRQGWFHPGDLGSLSPEGALFLKGRVDDQMNFAGIKIHPADIETVLLRHPAVAEAAAFPLRRSVAGDVPAAAVVLRSTATGEELLAFCREQLGSRAPAIVQILPALPRSAIGKVLKRVLAARLEG